jgi:two-component system, OmpR family, KDP operon response regulator KdpE
MSGARILLVEDEAPIRRFLRIALEAEGHHVSEAATARDGIRLAALDSPAAVILDLGLPDMDGLEVLRELRRWSSVPVLILSVRAGEAGKVEALDAGAQDYVTKPFGTRELLARLRGLLRDHGTAERGAVIEVAELRIDAAAHAATLDGRPLHLTRREFDLLWLLASNAGRLVTGPMILRHVWGPAHERDTQYLRVYVGQLREKLGDAAADPRWIFTEPGVGYRFRQV